MELRRDPAQVLAGRLAFWLGAAAFSGSSFLALAVASRFVGPGDLAGMTALLVLSLVAAVVPGSVQIDRAALAVDAGTAEEKLFRHRRGHRVAVAAMAVAALAALLFRLDLVGAMAIGAQFVPALHLSASRGALMGSERFHLLGISYGVEALSRFFTSALLAALWGEAGFGVGLLVATVVALGATRTRWFASRSSGKEGREAGGSDKAAKTAGAPGRPSVGISALAIASALGLANADLLGLSRRLAPEAADTFAAAAIPSKGVFIALFVAGWMFFSRVRRSGSGYEAVRLGVGAALAGTVLGLGATAAAPAVAVLLDKPRSPLPLVLLLCIAMALASGTWTLVNLCLSLGGRRTWVGSLLGLVTWFVLAFRASSALELTVSLLAANAVAFFTTARYGLSLEETAGSRSSPQEIGPARGTVGEGRLARLGIDPVYGGVVLSSMAAISFLQQPGRLIADTKIDLAIDPVFFLRRAYDTWEPLGYFGHVPNQSYGYFFPMGPYFVAARYLGVPTWVAQRLWILGVAATAFCGVCFLAKRLGLGTPKTRVAGAAFYVTAPVFATIVAFTSAAALPGAVLPWMLAFLVPGGKKWSPGGAAVRSAGAFAFGGAVNAAATLATLPAVVVFFMTTGIFRRTVARGADSKPAPAGGSRGSGDGARDAAQDASVDGSETVHTHLGQQRAGLRLALATAMCYAAVSAWWVVPLALMRSYGFNFLQYTETADAASSTQSLFESMRGSGYWLAFLNLRQPWLPGGWDYVSTPLLVAASGLLTAVGLAGVGLLGARKRYFAPVTLLVGLACASSAYWFTAPGLFHRQVLGFLNGSLGAFRNVSKFVYLITLPLALGLAHVGAATAASTIGRRRPAIRAVRTGGGWLVAVCLVGRALPGIRGQLATPGGFSEVPPYWQEAVSWLEEHGGGGRVLVVPGAPFGEYEWGRPLDEILQPLARFPWAVRSLIPLGGSGSMRLLDAVEDALLRQVPSPSLAPALASAGVAYLVVRNDLDWRRSGAPRPAQVKRTLEASGGFTLVAAFGTSHGEGPAQEGSSGRAPVPTDLPGAHAVTDTAELVEDLGVSEEEASLPKVAIYAVEGARGEPAAWSYLTDVVVVAGGAESRLALDSVDEYRGRPFVTSSDERSLRALESSETPVSAVVVTDDLRRRDHDFGLVHYNYSFTLGEGERPPGMGAAGRGDEVEQGISRGGDAPREIMESTDDSHKTTRYFEGAVRITASSYSSWLVQLPELRPYAAFDGDPGTAWVTGAPGRSSGEWIEIEFDNPVELPEVRITPLADNPFRPLVEEVEVQTDRGSELSALNPEERPQRVSVSPGPTRRMRVVLSRVRGDGNAGFSGAGLREIQIVGVAVREVVRTPRDLTSPAEAVILSRRNLHPSLVGRSDEEKVLRRSFRLDEPGYYRIEGTVVPQPGDELDRLIAIRGPIRVAASSAFYGLPEYRSSNLLDGATDTIWAASLAAPLPNPLGIWEGPKAYAGRNTPTPVFEGLQAPLDSNPSLVFDFGRPVRLEEFRVVTTTAGPVSPPASLRLSGERDQREAEVSEEGWVRFDPIVTRLLRIEFPAVKTRLSRDSMTGILTPLPVGLAEVEFPPLTGTAFSVPLPDEEVHIPCGMGPSVLVDGDLYDTEVYGRVSDLIFLRPLRFVACRTLVVTEAGEHRLDGLEGERPLSLSTVVLKRSTPPVRHAERSVHPVPAEKWGPRERALRVEPGPARLLYVDENVNRGWKAYVGGVELVPVTVDGWKQGFVLPSGVGGEVRLIYGPGRIQNLAITVGLALVAIVISLGFLAPAVFGSTADAAGPSPVESSAPYYAASSDAFRRHGTAIVVVLTIAVAVAVSVPVAILAAAGVVSGTAVRKVRKRVRRSALVLACAVVAAFAFGTATVLAVSALPALPADRTGAFGWPAQIASGVAAVCSTLSTLASWAPTTPSKGKK